MIRPAASDSRSETASPKESETNGSAGFEKPTHAGEFPSSWASEFLNWWILERARRVGLVQEKGEVRQLVRLLRPLRPRRILEIGTAHGGTFFLWTRVATPDALLISVDLPPWESEGETERQTLSRLRSFARTDQTVHLLRGDSHDGETISRVRAILSEAALDFLFLDGDHSYLGVRKDFEAYFPLLRPGGLAALHDIHPHSKGWGGDVPLFWRELRAHHKTSEILADPSQDGFAIGLLWR